MHQLPALKLTLVIGQYAMAYHFPKTKLNLTDTVRNWKAFDGSLLPLPHPSPRNNIWLKKNPWFEEELVPHMQTEINKHL
ncbi:MAG: uracil-DNA glycosylase [Saprospiraceae bacterium]